MSKQLSEEQLETALEMLAVGINGVGREKESLFLAKLCLVLANQLGDIDLLEWAIDQATVDLM
jgi:hypothetical protein